jgi:hypothetical protein
VAETGAILISRRFAALGSVVINAERSVGISMTWIVNTSPEVAHSSQSPLPTPMSFLIASATERLSSFINASKRSASSPCVLTGTFAIAFTNSSLSQLREIGGHGTQHILGRDYL